MEWEDRFYPDAAEGQGSYTASALAEGDSRMCGRPARLKSADLSPHSNITTTVTSRMSS